MHLLIKVPWLKRMYETVRCHIARASSFVVKVREEVSTHFTQSPSNVTVVCRVDCLACQDEFFVNNTLDAKEHYERCLDCALHLSCLFQSM
jgi:hypothetical protein